ncbi:hypothetical protein CyaNS01_01917 [Cyanobium sp. NS01]|nr:hypothetical protein CyaNS01_01917 [Cyanobium sp. NS01]
MIPFQEGIITAFSGRGAFFSQNGLDLGGGGNNTSTFRIY